MARITVEDCLDRIEDRNRWTRIHLAVERSRQHRKRSPVQKKKKNKEIVMTLREIAAGKVSFENINELEGASKKKSRKDKVSVDAVVDEIDMTETNE